MTEIKPVINPSFFAAAVVKPTHDRAREVGEQLTEKNEEVLPEVKAGLPEEVVVVKAGLPEEVVVVKAGLPDENSEKGLSKKKKRLRLI